MRTYIFGAGASREIGYPLATEMGDQLLNYMATSSELSIRASGNFLINTFGKSCNIEELITEAQSHIRKLKDGSSEERAERGRLGQSLAWLGVALQMWFREIRNMPAPSYAIFSNEIVQPGDVVITFNYDDSLERELKRAGKWDVSGGYGFTLGATEETSDVLVLKLHGSINWLVSIFGGATAGAFLVNPSSSLGNHPVIHRFDLESLGYSEFDGHTYQSGGAFPCLILPGRKKEFYYDTSMRQEYGDFWDSLWSQAANSLERSREVILAGYSLLPVDERACNLILQRTPKDARVEVISGSQTLRIANDFRAEGFGNVAPFDGGYFSDWCLSKTRCTA